jgi:hypothetical protein
MLCSRVSVLTVLVLGLIGCGHTRSKADVKAEATERAVLLEVLVNVQPEEYSILRWRISEASVRGRITDRSGDDCSDAVNDLRIVVPQGFQERAVSKPGCTIGQFILRNDYIGDRSGLRCVVDARRLDSTRPNEGKGGLTITAECGVNLAT